MTAEMELPPSVKQWERTNPQAFKIYKKSFFADREHQEELIKRNVQPIVKKTVEVINYQHQDVWKTFREASRQLEDPTDPMQIMALYEALYNQLELENKKKLAYHMAY
jgi:hypothetical protein